MSDPIEEMKKAGWREVCREDTISIYDGHHTISFVKPKEKPNAIVDFQAVKRAIATVNELNMHKPTCRACYAAVEEISGAIKKVE